MILRVCRRTTKFLNNPVEPGNAHSTARCNSTCVRGFKSPVKSPKHTQTRVSREVQDSDNRDPHGSATLEPVNNGRTPTGSFWRCKAPAVGCRCPRHCTGHLRPDCPRSGQTQKSKQAACFSTHRTSWHYEVTRR